MAETANDVTEWTGVANRVLGRGVLPYQFSGLLELPLRRFILSPKTLASRLPITPEFSVLEIGCGSGYYRVEVAKQLQAGHLKLLDLQPEMIRRCRRKIAGLRVTNVEFVAADGEALPFGDAEFDLVYMVTALGEVRDRKACLKSIKCVLRPGGVLSVSEHFPAPDFVSMNALVSLANPAGFTLERRYGTILAYSANFRVASHLDADRRKAGRS